MKHYPGNNIARKENGTGICLVMQGKESKTCPSDSFLNYFDLYIKQPIRENPSMLYNNYWKQFK